MESRSRVYALLLLAALAVVVQQALTVYPQEGLGPHLFWGGISMLLLWRISRRSSLSRYLFLCSAGAWFVLFLLTLASPDARLVLLVVAYAVQAVVVATPAVAAWTGDSGTAPEPLGS